MSRWKILNSKSLYQTGFFRLRVDECELPDGRVMPSYYVFELTDWVNILPITEDGRAVLVRQYRHAASEEFLEIPGGSTDGRTHEDPRPAAERELMEETGHGAKEWIYCGHHFPNPALQNNRMHTYLALGCTKVAELSLDPYEDLTVECVPLAELVKLWRGGHFKHSLISASLGLAFGHLQERGFKVF